MAGEFKEYDKKYRKLQGSFLEGERQVFGSGDATFFFPQEMQKPSHEEIRHAVYFAPGAEDWQRFRVSMKSMPASVKLARLNNRWIQKVVEQQNHFERIRIINYVDSMRRSGLIDETFKLKELSCLD